MAAKDVRQKSGRNDPWHRLATRKMEIWLWFQVYCKCQHKTYIFMLTFALCTHLLFLYGIRALEKVLGMQIHTFPVGGAFLIVVIAEVILIKLMPSKCWKLFGK